MAAFFKSSILSRRRAFPRRRPHLSSSAVVSGFGAPVRSSSSKSGRHLRNGFTPMSRSRAIRVRPGRASPTQVGHQTQSLTIFVDDVEARFDIAKAAGAMIVEDLHETVYGEHQFGVEDLEGHHWLFSRHARDVSPEEWGAKRADP